MRGIINWVLNPEDRDDYYFAIAVAADAASNLYKENRGELMNNVKAIVRWIETSRGEDRFLAICLLIECIQKCPEDLVLLRLTARAMITALDDDDPSVVGLVMPELADIMDVLHEDQELQEEFAKLQDEASLVMLWENNKATRDAACRIMDHQLPGPGSQSFISTCGVQGIQAVEMLLSR